MEAALAEMEPAEHHHVVHDEVGDTARIDANDGDTVVFSEEPRAEEVVDLPLHLWRALRYLQQNPGITHTMARADRKKADVNPNNFYELEKRGFASRDGARFFAADTHA